LNAFWRGWCGILGFAVIAACRAADSAGAPDDALLADSLASLIAAAYDFETPGTLERMNALYAESRDVVSASAGDIIISADSVRAGITRFWEQAGANMQEARWTWDEVHVKRLGPDAAVLTGLWSLPHIAPDGLPHTIEGAWTAVFERIDGKWKIVHEHLSQPSG
jgi:ketosteroid isomerase-like protein